MKQFLYLDYDRINSIIAQAEKGLIEGMTTEKDDENSQQNTKKIGTEIKGETGANILRLAKAEASLSADVEFVKLGKQYTATKEIISKTLHDASFDIAYAAIESVVVETGRDDLCPGDYIEINRSFRFVDIDYLEGLFSKDGIIDFIKKTEKEKIEQNKESYINENLNRDQKRHNTANINKAIKEQINIMEKKYDKMFDAVALLGKIIPYKRMLVSKDGFIIPFEDTYFRVNPHSLGFMFGGKIKCVGLITNIICKDTNDDNDVFSTLQFTVNEMLRGILPTNKNKLYIVSPLAIYYDN